MNAPNIQGFWSSRRTDKRPLLPACVRGRNWWIAALITITSLPAFAQRPASDTIATQRTAMQKLSFLVGQWSGPATISAGPGEPLHLTQTESVQYKLDGLVLLIESAGHTAEGKTVFRALATISFDDATNTYHFRACCATDSYELKGKSR